MQYYVSPTYPGFFVSALHGAQGAQGSVVPADAVEITPAQFVSLRDGVNSGQIILWSAGVPALGVAPVAAPTKADLIAYANAKQATVANGGISVNVAASGHAPQLVKVATDVQGRIDLAGAVQLSGLNPGQTFDWVSNAGKTTLTGVQVQQLGLAAGAFIQAAYSVLGDVLGAINAGTITTSSQVDDPTSVNLPAWPANS